jgi:regulator of protease activity HflC (stomatin/prohibitin superfamily)
LKKYWEPGAYWITPKRRLVLCDVRPTPFQVSAQELLTADGMGVRISLAGDYRVVSPALFVSESSDAFATFYLELRQSLRVVAGEMTSHDFFTGQAQLTAPMKDLLLPRETQLGVEMTKLDVYEAVPIGWLREV